MSESLNCNFYKYSGDPRVANKVFPDTPEYSCSTIQPLEPLSDLEIRLIIDYPNPEEGRTKPKVMDCNYVAIDGLYYKITNKERLPASSLAIYATIDGLASYWNQISQCEGFCKRAGNKVDGYISDPVLQTYPERYNKCGKFTATAGGGFSNENQIILTYIK